jgi:hypothetical protein
MRKLLITGYAAMLAATPGVALAADISGSASGWAIARNS